MRNPLQLQQVCTESELREAAKQSMFEAAQNLVKYGWTIEGAAEMQRVIDCKWQWVVAYRDPTEPKNELPDYYYPLEGLA